jgi:hypothetical protein
MADMGGIAPDDEMSIDEETSTIDSSFSELSQDEQETMPQDDQGTSAQDEQRAQGDSTPDDRSFSELYNEDHSGFSEPSLQALHKFVESGGPHALSKELEQRLPKEVRTELHSRFRDWCSILSQKLKENDGKRPNTPIFAISTSEVEFYRNTCRTATVMEMKPLLTRLPNGELNVCTDDLDLYYKHLSAYVLNEPGLVNWKFYQTLTEGTPTSPPQPVIHIFFATHRIDNLNMEQVLRYC